MGISEKVPKNREKTFKLEKTFTLLVPTLKLHGLRYWIGLTVQVSLL